MNDFPTLSARYVNHPAAVPDLLPESLWEKHQSALSFETPTKTNALLKDTASPTATALPESLAMPNTPSLLETDTDLNASPGQIHQRDVTHQSHSLHFFNGPLPDADELARYEAISPGLAHDMMTMLSRQNQADMDEQRRRRRAQEYRHTLALICAFLLAALAGLGGFDALVDGDTAAGLTLSGGSLSALVLAFLKATQQNDQ